MVGIRIHLDTGEVNALAAFIDDASARSVPLASAAIRKTALDIKKDARAFCPVDTGDLKNSITMSSTKLAAEIGPTADYGVYVELGTSRMAPHAFLGPAFDRRVHGLETALLQISELF